jgi:cytochrome c oxidase assembly protein subunit 15
MRISPATYRRITVVAAVLVSVIIVTGAAVRLTGSGLGCPSWPNCAPGRLTPQSATAYHAMVEFVNRTFTGLVAIGVMAAVLGSLVRSPRRRDLTWLSVGLVAGFFGQIPLGGITVLTHLNPFAVMSHFLLSMVLLADAVVLVRRAGVPDGASPRPTGTLGERRAAWVQFILATAVVTVGAVVTNSGPHAGDRRAHRFDLALTDVARVHSILAIALLVTLLAILVTAGRTGLTASRRRDLSLLMTVVVLQMAVGYVQYFTGVPALLVGVHILGAVLVFVASLRYLLGNRSDVAAEPTAAASEQPRGDARAGLAAQGGASR